MKIIKRKGRRRNENNRSGEEKPKAKYGGSMAAIMAAWQMQQSSYRVSIIAAETRKR